MSFAASGVGRDAASLRARARRFPGRHIVGPPGRRATAAANQQDSADDARPTPGCNMLNPLAAASGHIDPGDGNG